jgi:predicted ATPase
LSVQVAIKLQEAFADGVCFVALAPIRDPDLVAATIAQALGIKESGGQPLPTLLRDYLRDKRLLLVLDNCEHVLAAAPLISELLTTGRDLKVLATSRAPLHVRGEHLLPVPPLLLPNLARLPDLVTLAGYAAVALFVERAREAQPNFVLTDMHAPSVAAICAHLDGLPLAIELAATRVKLLPLPALLARLDNRLTLLTGGARDLPARQQTIRATIDWSYDLLEADTQPLFRRLAVFVGGCTLEAVAAVCNASGDLPRDVLDGLATLVDTSLLLRAEGGDGEPRFMMLETIREYALERLAESGEETEARSRHAKYFVALVERINTEGDEWEYWDERTRIEYPNLRDVLVWCRTAGLGGAPAADLGMRLARGLRIYWFSCDMHEGLRWLRELCGSAWCHGPAHLRARLLSSFGQYLDYSDDVSQSTSVLEEGLRLSRDIGDMEAIAEVCRHRGEVAKDRNDLAGADVWLTESLAAARAARSPRNIAWTQLIIGRVAEARGEYTEAVRLFEECLPIFQRLDDATGLAVVVRYYGTALLEIGDLDRAAKLLDDALGSAGVDWPVEEFRNLQECRGQVAYAQSDFWCASQHFVWALWFELETIQHIVPHRHHRGVVQHLLSEIAVVMAAQGHHIPATRLLSHAPERYYVEMPNLVRSNISRSLTTCRTALGEEAFAAAWAAGQALTLEQAIAEALAMPDGQ